MRQFVIIVVHVQGERVQKQKRCRNGTGEPTMKIYKNKCRYCGGDLEMYTHEDRNNVGKEGFTTSLTCRGCAGNLFEFSFTADDIPNAEKRLLERYGIKENDK